MEENKNEEIEQEKVSENIEVEQNNENTSKQPKSKKTFAIVIIVIACALIIGGGIILGQKLFEGNKENKNTAKEDKNTVEDNKDNNTNTIVDDNNNELSENEKKELYNKAVEFPAVGYLLSNANKEEISDDSIIHYLANANGVNIFSFYKEEGVRTYEKAKIDDVQKASKEKFGKEIDISKITNKTDSDIIIETASGFGVEEDELISIDTIGQNEYAIKFKYITDSTEIYTFIVNYDNGNVVYKSIVVDDVKIIKFNEITKDLILGNNFDNISVKYEKDDAPFRPYGVWIKELIINNKKVSNDLGSFYEITNIYEVDDNYFVIIDKGQDIRTTHYYLYDKNGNLLQEIYELDDNNMVINNVDDTTAPIFNGNIIELYGTRLTHGPSLVKGNRDYYICDKEALSKANVSDDYIVRAKYQLIYNSNKFEIKKISGTEETLGELIKEEKEQCDLYNEQ